MGQSAGQIMDAIVGMRLMSSEELAAYSQRAGLDIDALDAQTLLKSLVRDGKLTSFQANALYKGMAQALRIGDYIVLEKIGAGGMGDVYKAHHQFMDRVAAIKLLPAAMAQDERAVNRFYREVKAAAKLQHPHIVTAFDAGRHGSTFYLAMEYVDGVDLSRLIHDHGALPVDQVLNIGIQAAQALIYAHGLGVTHRDIKPGNILVDKHGDAKILDMGLARFEAEVARPEHSLTSDGGFLGTIEYMPPEQAANARDADQRSDIYALGATMYRALTGRQRLAGSTLAEKLIALREQPAPSLLDALPGFPVRLDGVIRKMLARDPDERHQSAEQVAAELQSCMRGFDAPSANRDLEALAAAAVRTRDDEATRTAVEAYALPASGDTSPTLAALERQSPEGAEPRRAAWPVVAVIGFILLCGFGATAFLLWGPKDADKPAPEVAIQTETPEEQIDISAAGEIDQPPTRALLRRESAADEQLSGAVSTEKPAPPDPQPAASETAPSTKTPPPSPADGEPKDDPDPAKPALTKADSPPPQPKPERPDPVNHVYLGDDHRFTGASKASVIMAGDRPVFVAGHTTGHIELYDVQTLAPITEWRYAAGSVTALATCDATGVIAAGFSDGQLVLLDASSGSPQRSVNLDHGLINALDFARSGRLLAVAAADGAFVVNISNLRRSEPFPKSRENVLVALSPDESLIAAYSGANGRLAVWDVRSREPVRQEQLKSQGLFLHFGRLGREIYAGRFDLNRIRLSDTGPGPLVGAISSESEPIVYGMDGRLSIVTDRPAQRQVIWDPMTRKIFQQFDDIRLNRAAFSEDGNWFAGFGIVNNVAGKCLFSGRVQLGAWLPHQFDATEAVAFVEQRWGEQLTRAAEAGDDRQRRRYLQAVLGDLRRFLDQPAITTEAVGRMLKAIDGRSGLRELAVQAAALAVERAPGEAQPLQRQVLGGLRRAYLQARAQGGDAEAAAYIDALRAMADANAAALDYAEAQLLIKQAIAVDNEAGRQHTEVLQRLTRLYSRRQRLLAQARRRAAALERNPDNAKLRHDLFMLYLAGLDNPAAARPYVRPGDSSSKELLEAAITDDRDLDADTLFKLGAWYRAHARKADKAHRSALAMRARRYYESFMSASDANDSRRHEARQALDSLQAG